MQPESLSPSLGLNRRWLSRYLEQHEAEQENFWIKPSLLLPEDFSNAWSCETHTLPAAGKDV